MNKRTVLELARVAGLAESVDDYNPYWTADDTDTLERFAKLIAEHERAECAKAIDDSANICAPGPIQTVLREQARCIRSRT